MGSTSAKAQEGGGGDAQAAAEAHDGDALLAAGGPPALGLLVELGAAELGELLGLLDAQEGGKVLDLHVATPGSTSYTAVSCPSIMEPTTGLRKGNQQQRCP